MGGDKWMDFFFDKTCWGGGAEGVLVNVCEQIFKCHFYSSRRICVQTYFEIHE